MIDHHITQLIETNDRMRHTLNEMLKDPINNIPDRKREIEARLANLSFVIAQLNGIQSVLVETECFIEDIQ